MKDTKIEVEDYLLLTYAAIAKEIEYYGLLGEDTIRVVVAAGLPFTRFGEEKVSFSNYLKRGVVTFVYEGKIYFIEIEEVLLYPLWSKRLNPRTQIEKINCWHFENSKIAIVKVKSL